MNIGIYDLVKDYIKTFLIDKFKLSNVNHSLEYTIMKNIYFELIDYGIGIYANELYKKVEKRINKKQKRKYFYSILDKLAKNNLITIEKKEGFKILCVPTGHKENLFNLIKKLQNSNYQYNRFIQEFNEAYCPNPKLIRDLALIEFKNKKMLDVFDRNKLKMIFELYLQKITDKKIILYHKDLKKLLKIDYKTRFNSASKLYEKIDLFYKLFDNAKAKFKDAVFITLTLNPKCFNNIYDASKKVSIAWNRFLSYLKKKFNKKITYINVFEFQKNGLIHLHAVLFGFRWLMPQKKLSSIWNKYGMGKIVYLYRLKLDNEEESFKFDRYKPKNTKTNDIEDYLIKYLKKSFYDKDELSLYWLTNKRFYTYSRDLKEKEEGNIIKAGYDFIGVFSKGIFEDFEDDEFINVFIINFNDKKIKNYWGYG